MALTIDKISTRPSPSPRPEYVAERESSHGPHSSSRSQVGIHSGSQAASLAPECVLDAEQE